MQNPGLYAAPGLVVGGKQKTIRKALLSNVWVFPKIGGKPPKSSHFNRVSPYFHHPFWWFSPYFWRHLRVLFGIERACQILWSHWTQTINYPPFQTNECPLKINGWKMYFLLKWFHFWGHVNFQGGIYACLYVSVLFVHSIYLKYI